MPLSYGFIETQGLIGSIEAADAMLKAAKVELVHKTEIGFGLVTVFIEGELGAVQSAIEAGSAAAEKVGQFVTAHVIARPFNAATVFKNEPATGIAEPLIQHETKIKEEKTPLKEAAAKAVPKKAEKTIKERPLDLAAQIIKSLKSMKNGATLTELAGKLKQDSAQIRIVLKQLIDQEKIEKVQQRYYLL